MLDRYQWQPLHYRLLTWDRNSQHVEDWTIFSLKTMKTGHYRNYTLKMVWPSDLHKTQNLLTKTLHFQLIFNGCVKSVFWDYCPYVIYACSSWGSELLRLVQVTFRFVSILWCYINFLFVELLVCLLAVCRVCFKCILWA